MSKRDQDYDAAVVDLKKEIQAAVLKEAGFCLEG